MTRAKRVDFDGYLENYQVHPAAARQPKPSDDELDELAADIATHGLIHPIVLDGQGQILDGRSRMVACEIAGVAPRFETYDGQHPAWYALTVNINRRHLRPGQRYMLLALARRDAAASFPALENDAGVRASRLSEAALVIEYAPELIGAVSDGEMSLESAYGTARARKPRRKSLASVTESDASASRPSPPHPTDETGTSQPVRVPPQPGGPVESAPGVDVGVVDTTPPVTAVATDEPAGGGVAVGQSPVAGGDTPEVVEAGLVIEAAKLSAATLAADVRKRVGLIVAGVRWGAPQIAPADMVVDMVCALRAAADELEGLLT